MTATAMRAVAGIILTVGVASLPYAQERPESKYSRTYFVPSGFLKAGEFVDLPPQMKEGYAMGFLNGVMASTALRADEQEVIMLSKCTNGMDSGQLAEIIVKYVRSNPEKWHLPLNAESFSAFLSICPALKAKMAKE